MTNPTDDSSGRQFPPGSPALTRYPLDDEQAKAAPGTWPWVVATVVSRAGPGRWTLAVEDPPGDRRR